MSKTTSLLRGIRSQSIPFPSQLFGTDFIKLSKRAEKIQWPSHMNFLQVLNVSTYRITQVCIFATMHRFLCYHRKNSVCLSGGHDLLPPAFVSLFRYGGGWNDVNSLRGYRRFPRTILPGRGHAASRPRGKVIPTADAKLSKASCKSNRKEETR